MAFLLTDGSWFAISPLITVMNVSVGNKAFNWAGKERKQICSTRYVKKNMTIRQLKPKLKTGKNTVENHLVFNQD